MKKILICLLVAFSVTQVWSQDAKLTKVPLVGEKAPVFTAVTTNGTINFPGDYGHKWKMLLSHPQDWTPVCTSELLELAYAQSEFEKMDVAIAVISTDPIDQHIQWKKAMEEINYQGRGTTKMKFPIIDDEKLLVSKKYGMIHPSTNNTKDVRGVFIIDPDNVIQAIFFYPMNIGRNIEELKRTITALQTAEKNAVLTPANWEKGKPVLVHIKPVTEKEKAGTTEVTWFMTFKELLD